MENRPQSLRKRNTSMTPEIPTPLTPKGNVILAQISFIPVIKDEITVLAISLHLFEKYVLKRQY